MLLVAGGAGFVGSAFVRHRLDRHPTDRIRVLDKLTYAGRWESLDGLPKGRVELIHGDVADRTAVRDAMDGCDAVVNLAAETHVDRSIRAEGDFLRTNVIGAATILEAARDARIRHLQVSTDEVYGPITHGSVTEAAQLRPSSPYSATKAAADLMVMAFDRTFRSDVLICRPSNTYGPRQHPEKLVPLSILNALTGENLPVYGDGLQVRNWLHVEDCCAAVDLVLEHGAAGGTYNVAGPDELSNMQVVRRILDHVGADERLIEHVADRRGHDRRYSTNATKAHTLGWRPKIDFDQGVADTVAWYRENSWWWQPIRAGEYRRWYELQYGRSLSAEFASM